jgi:hypothetical protein
MATRRTDLGARLSYPETGTADPLTSPVEQLTSKALGILSDDKVCLYFSRPILKGLDLRTAINLKVSPAHPGTLTRVNDRTAVWTADRPLALKSKYNFQLLSLKANGQKWSFPTSEFTVIEHETPFFVIVKFLAVYDRQKNIELYAFLSAPPDFKEFAKHVEIRLNGKRFQTEWRQGLTPDVMRTTLKTGVHKKPLNLTVNVSGNVPAQAQPSHTLPLHKGTPLTLDPPIILPSPTIQFESPTRDAVAFYGQQMKGRRAPGPDETMLATARLPEVFPDWPLTEEEMAGYAAPDEQIAIHFSAGLAAPVKDTQLAIDPWIDGQFESSEDGMVVWTPKKPLEYERVYTFRLLSAAINEKKVAFPPSPQTEIKIKARRFGIWAYKTQQMSNALTRLYLFLSGPVELANFAKSVAIERGGRPLPTSWKGYASGRILSADLALAASSQPLTLNLKVRRAIPALHYKNHKILPQTRPITLLPSVFERQWNEFDIHMEAIDFDEGLE